MSDIKILINDRIPAIISMPETIDNQHPAVVLVHGFASEKNEVNDFYVTLSHLLKEAGVCTLRFDLNGHGENNPDDIHNTIDKMLDDLLHAHKYLTSHEFIDPNKISIVGFSLGSYLSILASNQVMFSSQILISPTFNLLNDFNCFLGEKTMRELKDCDDHIILELPWKTLRLGKALYKSLDYMFDNLPRYISCFKGNRLMVAGSNDFSSANSKRIDSCSSSNKTTINIIDGADHIFNMPDSTNKLNYVAETICQFIHNQYELTDNSTHEALARL